MSSPARVARRCSFVCSATSFRTGIRAHGVCAVSSTLVMWLPVLTPRRSWKALGVSLGVHIASGPRASPDSGGGGPLRGKVWALRLHLDSGCRLKNGIKRGRSAHDGDLQRARQGWRVDHRRGQ
jgi:hypothetical protein